MIYLMPRWVKEKRTEDARPPWWGQVWFRGKGWLAASVAASLATAPLVALYFQVVSVLGVVVNLAAIPLVLGLALPLGEAGVLAQALSLTPVARALLAVGQWPLWLGYQAITWTAQLPGSAIIAPIPTWFQIVLYYVCLALVFAPRRSYLTRTGAGLAGLALAGSVMLPLWLAPQALEVTCLDTRGDLAGVVVAPEGRRLVFSAPAASWGRQGGGWGVLPGYLHWRQSRRLDQVAALTLSRDNGQELLTLCRQFDVGEVWFGRRGPQGPPSWSLWNFLGDLGRPPRSLERGPPPASLGGVGLKFLPLGEDKETALLLTYQDRRALIIPPLKGLETKDAAGLPQGVEVLIVPQALLSSQGQSLAARVQPRRWVIYGESRRRSGQDLDFRPPDHASHFTQEGAVSVFLDENGSWVRQWQP
jgi:beta-lactamase superfamily II metal-dependent hydrolase